jgi:hypothetical protein
MFESQKGICLYRDTFGITRYLCALISSTRPVNLNIFDLTGLAALSM